MILRGGKKKRKEKNTRLSQWVADLERGVLCEEKALRAALQGEIAA